MCQGGCKGKCGCNVSSITKGEKGDQGDVGPSGGLGYLVYTALLTQAGTSAPSVVILQNTIGNIIWTRQNTGRYLGALVGAFPVTKTFVAAMPQEDVIIRSLLRVDDDSVQIKNYNTGSYADNDLVNTAIEIRVYP